MDRGRDVGARSCCSSPLSRATYFLLCRTLYLLKINPASGISVRMYHFQDVSLDSYQMYDIPDVQPFECFNLERRQLRLGKLQTIFLSHPLFWDVPGLYVQ